MKTINTFGNTFGVKSLRGYQSQKGVVLFLSLIILVAMTLAGIGMVRSVDTANVVAGNLAFRQSTLLSADAGIQAGYQWLRSAQLAKTLSNTNATAGYYSNIPAAEPDWQAETTWANSPQVGPDAAGNTVQYLMHRACTVSNTPPSASRAPGLPNKCATDLTFKNDTTSTGLGNDGDPNFVSPDPSEGFVYRITSRVKGPRNTISIAQATVIFEQ